MKKHVVESPHRGHFARQRRRRSQLQTLYKERGGGIWLGRILFLFNWRSSQERTHVVEVFTDFHRRLERLSVLLNGHALRGIKNWPFSIAFSMWLLYFVTARIMKMTVFLLRGSRAVAQKGQSPVLQNFVLFGAATQKGWEEITNFYNVKHPIPTVPISSFNILEGEGEGLLKLLMI